MAGGRPAARSGARSRWSTIERDLRAAGGGPLIAGVDEVGRGPLAGPVVACAVIMAPGARAIAGVDDSKRLAPSERERLARRIRERALAVGVGAASVREIDALNIYHATVLAMRRALAQLPVRPDHVLIDGVPLRTLGVEHTAVVSGDARCYHIASASIVAKVTRDRLMARLATRYPGYRWEQNAGYATPEHLAALAERGPTPHHRRSFARVRQLELPFGLPVGDCPAPAGRALGGADEPGPARPHADDGPGLPDGEGGPAHAVDAADVDPEVAPDLDPDPEPR